MATTERELSPARPPRDNLVRASSGGFHVRAAGDGGGMPTLFGHFLRFGEWTEIDSIWEGRFMEQIAPGAAKKTIKENREAMRILFQHGQDPQIGDKPLAPIDDVREDDEGVYYEGEMLDTSYNRDLIPGLEAGQYGASFRFRVMREEINEDPGVSDHNPAGLPERVIREMQIMEFGPVTFPAYAGASAAVRSLTDEFLFDRLAGDKDRLRQLVTFVNEKEHPAPAPSKASAPAPVATPSPERREPARKSDPAPEPKEDPMPVDLDRFSTIDDLNARAAEVQTRMDEMSATAGTRAFNTEDQAEFDGLAEEKGAIRQRLDYLAEREAQVLDGVERGAVERPTPARRTAPNQIRVPDNIYDLGAYRQAATSRDDELRLLRDGAMRAVEGASFPQLPRREDGQAHIQRLLDTIDYADEETGKVGGEIARRILITGSPLYRRAMDKWLRAQGREGVLAPEEARALSLGTGSAGGFAVVYELDPTIVPTSNFSVNPYRAIARIVQIAGTNEWKAVTSGSTTFTFTAEATEVGDNSPTLAQPDIIAEKAQAFIPFSVELGQDWGSLQAEMASLLQDAKDDVEATKYTLGAGHGSTEPKGIITAATTTVTAGGSGAFAIADLYKALEALPPRYRPNARWLGNLFTFDKVRQFDTAGGSGVWVDSLQPASGGMAAGTLTANQDVGPGILGRRAYESTAMDAALTTGSKILVVGDFRYFVIVDRIGMNLEFLPLVVGTNHRPTGQRGLYAWYRTSSDALSAAAFRVLVTG